MLLCPQSKSSDSHLPQNQLCLPAKSKQVLQKPITSMLLIFHLNHQQIFVCTSLSLVILKIQKKLRKNYK